MIIKPLNPYKHCFLLPNSPLIVVEMPRRAGTYTIRPFFGHGTIANYGIICVAAFIFYHTFTMSHTYVMKTRRGTVSVVGLAVLVDYY